MYDSDFKSGISFNRILTLRPSSGPFVFAFVGEVRYWIVLLWPQFARCNEHLFLSYQVAEILFFASRVWYSEALAKQIMHHMLLISDVIDVEGHIPRIPDFLDILTPIV